MLAAVRGVERHTDRRRIAVVANGLDLVFVHNMVYDRGHVEMLREQARLDRFSRIAEGDAAGFDDFAENAEGGVIVARAFLGQLAVRGRGAGRVVSRYA